ncbi:hypothetical protein CSUI_000960 [Cystoisospora suis]|uniref:Transcription initiation factor IIF subunit alpha n=1 Tax=Cystoisospora suis TaxID=483139 RepID=A0A2C6LC25_9APIC|nr:hypothetical protein CSUI_000960 [Cystoisospora suis]
MLRSTRPSPGGGPLGPTPRIPRRSPATESTQSRPTGDEPQSSSTQQGLSGLRNPPGPAASSRSIRPVPPNQQVAQGSAPGHLARSTLPSIKGPVASSREASFDEQVDRLVSDGAAESRNRLRVSGLNRRPLLIARIPELLSALQTPLSIQKDIPVVGTPHSVDVSTAMPPGEENNTRLLTEGKSAAPWRLRDSSDIAEEASGNSATGGEDKPEDGPRPRKMAKVFVSKPSDVNTDCFFLLVQGKEFVEILPISGWVNFERTVVAKGDMQARVTADDAERETRVKAARDAALAARVEQLRRGGGAESDEENTSATSKQKPSGSADNKAGERDNDDLGLRRQKEKRMKRLRQKNQQKLNEYIDSALSVTSLRQAEVDWDFEEGERSDDEDDVAAEQKQQGGEDGDLFGAGGAAGAEELVGGGSDEEDAGGSADGADLTNYGQKMKTLLDKAKDDEADDELHQYESDDDNEGEEGEGSGGGAGAASASSGTTETTAGGSSSSSAPTAVSSSSSSASGPGARSSAGSGAQGGPSTGGGSKAAPAEGDLKSRIIRVMQQNMGRMTVKNFMTVFKVKENNDEFKRIQKIVHAICRVESVGEKQKFIILRPEYRQ